MQKLKRWEKDFCRAYIKMYIARGIEPDASWLEPEISRLIDNMNNDHRMLIEEYLLTLLGQTYRQSYKNKSNRGQSRSGKPEKNT